MVKPN